MKKNVRRAVAVGITGAVLAGTGSAFAAITGSGATFPRIAYENWCRDSGLCSYTGKGSTGGIRDFINGVVDVAGTDATLTDQQLADLAAKRGGVTPLYFPTLLGAITVPVNIPGVSGNAVKLDGKVVGEIFAGSIKTWNDAKIKATNPKVKLPSAPITVCVRSDGSGTTFGFTRYLTKVSPVFKSQVNFGQTVGWGSASIVKQPGNAGVGNCVKSNQNSIGYVDLGDAINAGLGSNITSIGKSQIVKRGKKSVRKTVFIRPTVASIQAAGNLSAIKSDLTIDFSASPAAGAYPIVSTTWILAYSDYGKAGKSGSLADVKSFLNYAYGAAAQGKLASLGFAPLPTPVVTAAKKQLALLK
ncbi:MAG: phosphate ABC transporter substrate-binding protein PstS [Actinomycetota bacterium]